LPDSHSPAGLGLRWDTRFERPGHSYEVPDRDTLYFRRHEHDRFRSVRNDHD